MSYLTKEELLKIGFESFGENVSVSNKASIYNPHKIIIGDNTRIDDFVVLSAGDGGIEIGDNVHVAIFSSLIGSGKIFINNYSNISSRVSIYSSSDDFSGDYMTNPTVNSKYTNVLNGDVIIGKHVIVGSGSIILPKVKIGDGVAIGALSLVKKDCMSFSMYAGVPARFLKKRSKKLLELEQMINKKI